METKGSKSTHQQFICKHYNEFMKEAGYTNNCESKQLSISYQHHNETAEARPT